VTIRQRLRQRSAPGGQRSDCAKTIAVPDQEGYRKGQLLADRQTDPSQQPNLAYLDIAHGLAELKVSFGVGQARFEQINRVGQTGFVARYDIVLQ